VNSNCSAGTQLLVSDSGMRRDSLRALEIPDRDPLPSVRQAEFDGRMSRCGKRARNAATAIMEKRQRNDRMV